MKTSELLTEAKKYLPTHSLGGVCSAVVKARVNLKHSMQEEDVEKLLQTEQRLHMHIEDQLAGFNFATSWLAAQVLHPERTEVVTRITCGFSLGQLWDWVDRQDPKNIQSWRLAWMDKMIAEFQAKGD